jgi:hypothetical protein
MPTRHLFHALLIATLAGPAVATAHTVSPAATRGGSTPSDLAASCQDSTTAEDRRNCLADLRAAEAAGRRGQLTTLDAETLARNLRERCNRLPADDRSACLRRMNGEGTVSGSVEGGGLLRELVIVEPGEPDKP